MKFELASINIREDKIWATTFLGWRRDAKGYSGKGYSGLRKPSFAIVAIWVREVDG
jgi:hypothetical protein